MEILFKTTMPICVYHWPFKKKIQGLLSYIIFIYSFFSGGGVGWTSASKLKLYRRCYLLKKKKIVWKVLTAMSSCCLVFLYIEQNDMKFTIALWDI